MATTKKFTIKNWVGNQYVDIYPKTVAEQVIQDDNRQFVTKAQKDQWSAKQNALGYVPENSSNKGRAGGYVGLDSTGKIPASNLPKEAIIDAFEVASEDAMLKLKAQKGDICVRTDQHKTYVLAASDPTQKTNWIHLQSEVAPVTSVNGKVGAVVITADSIGAVKTSEVTTTAQANKILKLNASAKLPASITGDAATVCGKSVNDTKTDGNSLWTASKVNTEIQNAVGSVITSLDWKASVESYGDIVKIYPNPEDGWTVNVKDTDITYRYTGTEWIAISANAIPNATDTIDGKMSKEDKAKLDGVAPRANLYVHPESHQASMIIEDATHQFITAEQKTKYEKNTTYTNNMPTVSSLGGISSGTTFNNVPINDLLTNLLYPYIAPTISLAVNPPTGTIREHGSQITQITLTARTTKKSKPITEVKFYRDNVIINTVSAPAAGGGNETFTVNTPVTTNTSFKASVYDGKTMVYSTIYSYVFVHPMYVGDVTSASPSVEEIKRMEKLVISKPLTRQKSHTLANARFCIAYPASYGNLRSILDANQFEIINDFVKETKTITCLNGESQQYNVYTFKNIVTFSGFMVTYKF